MAMTTEAPAETSVLTVSVDEKKLNMIEAIAAECTALSYSDVKPLLRAMRISQAIKMLRDLLNDNIMEEIMRLQSTRLGFRTDKDSSGGYQKNVVRECVIEATVRGACWVGNEFNIIAGNTYLTKEYFVRVQSEFPELTDLQMQAAVPELRGDTARVGYVATWKLRGRLDSLECVVRKNADGIEADYRIPVKVNNGMGPDAILGKAERKMRARIMQRLTGNFQQYPDGDADDASPAASGPAPQNLEDLTNKLLTNGSGAKPEESADDNVIRTFEARITECETAMELQQVAGDLKAVKMSDAQRDALRTLWAKRQKELK